MARLPSLSQSWSWIEAELAVLFACNFELHNMSTLQMMHLLIAEDAQQANREFAALSRTAKDLQESAQLYHAQVLSPMCTVASVDDLWYGDVLVGSIAQSYQLHCFRFSSGAGSGSETNVYNSTNCMCLPAISISV